MNKNIKKYMILTSILILAFLLRLKPFVTKEIPFIFDTGRDMVWTRDIVVLKDFTLIGPWTSLTGVFFGPLWYYLLALFFIPLGGHPITGTALSTFISLATVLLLYIVGKKTKNHYLGLILAFLGAVYPIMIGTSVTSLNPNPIIFLSPLIIYLLYILPKSKNNKFWKYLAALFFTVSLIFHFSTPTALYFTLLLIFYLIYLFIKTKQFKIKKFLISGIFFIIPFAPQILFELRNNFLQIRSFASFLTGKSNSLQGYLPIFERTLNRWGILWGFFKKMLPLNQSVIVQIFFSLLIIYAYYLVYKKKDKLKSLYDLCFLLLISSFFVFNFLFKAALRPWYVFHIPMTFIILLGTSFWVVLKEHKFLKYLMPILIIGFLLNVNFIASLKFKQTTPDISEYRSQKKVIEYIYNDANKTPFNVYVFTPALYDFHYQYSFWWIGRKRNFWPVEYAYLPGKVEYVPNKQRYYDRQKQIMGDKKAEITYLIIETKDNPNFPGWHGYFEELDLISEKEFESGIILEKRH